MKIEKSNLDQVLAITPPTIFEDFRHFHPDILLSTMKSSLPLDSLFIITLQTLLIINYTQYIGQRQ